MKADLLLVIVGAKTYGQPLTAYDTTPPIVDEVIKFSLFFVYTKKMRGELSPTIIGEKSRVRPYTGWTA